MSHPLRHVGAAQNSFVPHNLIIDEAWMLYHVLYLAPPDYHLPSTWRMAANNVDILPELTRGSTR